MLSAMGCVFRSLCLFTVVVASMGKWKIWRKLLILEGKKGAIYRGSYLSGGFSSWAPYGFTADLSPIMVGVEVRKFDILNVLDGRKMCCRMQVGQCDSSSPRLVCVISMWRENLVS